MTLLETNLGSGTIPKRQGKVRDVYDLGDRLLWSRPIASARSIGSCPTASPTRDAS